MEDFLNGAPNFIPLDSGIIGERRSCVLMAIAQGRGDRLPRHWPNRTNIVLLTRLGFFGQELGVRHLTKDPHQEDREAKIATTPSGREIQNSTGQMEQGRDR